jgi:hypothetical protein
MQAEKIDPKGRDSRGGNIGGTRCPRCQSANVLRPRQSLSVHI